MTVQATSVSGDPNVALFKRVYGDMHDLTVTEQKLANDIPWSDGNRVGDVFVEDVILGDEVGITLGGNGQDAFEINAAIAGAVRQTQVQPYVTILPSVLPFATVSRSNGDEAAFMQATKFITKNNLKSHNDFQEIFRLYGQSADLLGYISYFSGTFRKQAFTAGTGTLNGLAFVNGVCAASKAILFEPGQFAAGHWVGKKGVKVKQVDSTNAIVASGKLVSVNARYCYIIVDFAPVVPTAETDGTSTPVSGSMRLCFDRQEDAQEMIGIQKILSNTGTSFNIDTTKFELFRGNVVDNGRTKLTLAKSTSPTR